MPSRTSKRQHEATIQMNTRVSPECREVLDSAIEVHGLSLRQAVEMAIMEKWGQNVEAGPR